MGILRRKIVEKKTAVGVKPFGSGNMLYQKLLHYIRTNLSKVSGHYIVKAFRIFSALLKIGKKGGALGISEGNIAVGEGRVKSTL